MVPTIGLMMTDFLQQCVLLKRILFFQKANGAYVSIPESVPELCSELGLPFVDLLNSSDGSRTTQTLLTSACLTALEMRGYQLQTVGNVRGFTMDLMSARVMPTPLISLPLQFRVLNDVFCHFLVLVLN